MANPPFVPQKHFSLSTKEAMFSVLTYAVISMSYISNVSAWTPSLNGFGRSAFGINRHSLPQLSDPATQSSELFSTFAADGSEYASRDDFVDDDADEAAQKEGYSGYKMEEDEDETTELSPVPMSKNAGNRFVAMMWDRELVAERDKGVEEEKQRDALDMHYDHIALTEDHVMLCRKSNLYNETFNTDSMVDVLWSLPVLSSDLMRVIGQALILESTELSHVVEFLEREPIARMLTGGKTEKIPLYRWRHIRDYSLRMDDGRFGFPCLCWALDDTDEGSKAGSVSSAALREEVLPEMLEYMIRSERVIAAGPLHFTTELKDDPSSLPVGDLILFNAKNREDAVSWVENLPSAREGLYGELRVHFYNRLDVTGKFVSDDPLEEAPCEQMKEAMEVWGYPVADNQTPWLNW